LTTKTVSTKKKDIAIRNSILSLLTILLVPTGTLLSQDRDAGLWTGIEIEKGLNKWLDLNASLEMRRINNFSQPQKYFGEVGLSAGLGQYIDVSIYYRYNQRFIPEYNWTQIHRVYTNLRLKYDWNYFSLSERFRLTMDKNPAFLDDSFFEATGRAKTQLQYNIRKTPLRVRTAVELFTPLSRTDVIYAEKSRYILGMVYVINPSMSLEISHYYQHTSFRNKPLKNYIWVIRFHYDL